MMAVQGPLSGQKLGDKYLLGDLIGQGGFGVVYQAQHLLLGRQQAIKVLMEQHFINPKFRERFLREARTLATLDHGNILPVHDFGLEQNRAYLVMPYISGGTLESMLRGTQRTMGLGAIWRCLEQICLALDYAHTRNVAHLDLKPGNLLVHEDGRLLLADFGLAHLMEQGAVEGSTSLQFGTPAYMSPEHLQGHPERRSDIYAVGVILYQMLTGRVPFEGSTPAIIIVKHLNEPPPLLRAVRPDLPSQLEDVLSKALAKDPNARYQTAGELLAGFKAALSGPTIASLSGAISDPNTPTRIGNLYSDPTLRAEQPPVPTIPAELYQELAELKEAVRKLSQVQALPAVAHPAAPPAEQPLQEAAPPAELPPIEAAPMAEQPSKEAMSPAERIQAGSEPAPKEAQINYDARTSLVLAVLALGITIISIIVAFIASHQIAYVCDFYSSDLNDCVSQHASGYYFNFGTFLIVIIIGLVLASLPGIPAIILGRKARKQIRQSKAG